MEQKDLSHLNTISERLSRSRERNDQSTLGKIRHAQIIKEFKNELYHLDGDLTIETLTDDELLKELLNQ